MTDALKRLNEDLQRSCERLVIAREEERRRLRRDLHDELAPTLAALALSASTAADLIATDPASARSLVTDLEEAIREAVGGIRRLVYELRPPTLDELGLLGAVRDRAAQLSGRRHEGAQAKAPGKLEVFVEAPESLPPLPAAVEVAAYRIVQEALNNVVRHARTRTCTVRLGLGDELEVDITDDGVGLPVGRHAGVGLRSMRERATELGGTCVIESTEGTGTRVCARLPVPKEDPRRR